ncbi:hypothetical protein Tco_1545686 [Tanacetum coccineum]
MSPPAEPDTPSEHEPDVKVATIGTIIQVPLTRHMPFSSIHVRIRSSSTAPAGHDPEDFVLSRIRSDLDALHGRFRVIKEDGIRAKNKRLKMMLESAEECIREMCSGMELLRRRGQMRPS